MFKRFLVCALALTMMICVVGCGGQKMDANADKAVRAYAEMIVQGESSNMAAAGISDADKDEIRKQFADSFVAGLSNIVPLTDESAKTLVEKFYARFKKDMKFSATLKKDDPEQPVVELKTTPMDNDAGAKALAANNDFIALLGMVGKLQSEGATPDQLKNNAELQKLAITAFTAYIDGITFKSEQTFDVACAKVKGSDGKMHWAPADMNTFTNFIMGQQ